MDKGMWKLTSWKKMEIKAIHKRWKLKRFHIDVRKENDIIIKLKTFSNLKIRTDIYYLIVFVYE